MTSPTNDVNEASSYACDGCSDYDDNGNITPSRFELADCEKGSAQGGCGFNPSLSETLGRVVSDNATHLESHQALHAPR